MHKVEDFGNSFQIIYSDGQSYKFEKISEVPTGKYVIWAIGRSNFPIESYIPITLLKENSYAIQESSLKALYIEDEEFCKYLLQQAVKRQTKVKDIQKLAKKFYSES